MSRAPLTRATRPLSALLLDVFCRAQSSRTGRLFISGCYVSDLSGAQSRNLQYLIQPDAVSVRPDALQVPVSYEKVSKLAEYAQVLRRGHVAGQPGITLRSNVVVVHSCRRIRVPATSFNELNHF
ncbi:hypothetical protein HYQ44_015409 [Verticillium longisporum]|nr:hypothetical protein HYQ44_015409 [Verticillium longisporum]